MPPFRFRVAIVLCWLATTGWLLWRQVEPWLHGGEPPPYAIDLVDEAQRGPLKIHWDVRYKGAETHSAVSSVVYNTEADDFELSVRIDARTLHAEPAAGRPRLPTSVDAVQFQRIVSSQTVTREGRLKRMEDSLRGSVVGQEFEATLKGEVRGDQFFAEYAARVLNEKFAGKIDAVPVSSRGSVLNPLHPLNRVQGIHPGQKWHMPLIDPTRDAVFAGLKSIGLDPATLNLDPRPPVLDVQVLPEARAERWQHHDVPCLVIEYRERDRLRARTLLERTTGLVIAQEVYEDEEEGVAAERRVPLWKFIRETAIEGLSGL